MVQQTQNSSPDAHQHSFNIAEQEFEGHGSASVLAEARQELLENSMVSGARKQPPGNINSSSKPEDYYHSPTSSIPTPELDKNGRDLTREAAQGRLDPALDREEEIKQLVQTLTRRTKNNPVLIGEPGVGKTAVVEELAYRIQAGLIPELEGKRVVSIEMGGLLAGTQLRGSFEEKLKNIVKEAQQAGNVILFIDELHTVISSGASEGGLNAGNMLKPALARGEISVIGATTIDEYRQHIEKDGALERRFKPILLKEPGKETTLDIVRGVVDLYEDHHKVLYSEEALKAAVKFSDRYIGDRYQPDKSLDLLDEAGSRLKVKLSKDPSLSPVVTQNDIAEVVSSMTGIPIGTVTKERAELATDLASRMKERIKGQDDVVDTLAKAEMREVSGMRDPNKPLSFFFIGPTGVGKTYSFQVYAEETGRPLIRFDMSEFMESHTVSKLLGAPPGYIGYEEPGKLTELIRRHPNAVVLFDEFDKAHREVQNVLLQMIDDGRLTDSKGRSIDCSNVVVGMTANVGAESQGKPAFGFDAPLSEGLQKKSYEETRKKVQEVLLKGGYTPEFINRIDGIAQFNSLSHEHKVEVTKVAIQELTAIARSNCNLTLEVSDEAVKFIAQEGFDPQFGARSVRRTVQSLVADPLTDALLEGRIRQGDKVRIEYSSDNKAIELIPEQELTYTPAR